MKVTCSKCQKGYKLSQSKLPRGKKIALKCSACGDPIVIDLRSPKKIHKAPPAPDPVAKEASTNTSGPKSFNRKQPGGMALKYGILRSMSDLQAPATGLSNDAGRDTFGFLPY